MKKISVCILALFITLSAMISPCAAASQPDGEIIYLEDGSYFVVTLETFSGAKAGNTISGSKTYHYYDDKDVLQWSFVLTGTFSYDPGISATCTSAACNAQISNSFWSCSSKSANPSGNRAVGNAEVIKKVLFITVQTVPVSLSITCDTNGNLS